MRCLCVGQDDTVPRRYSVCMVKHMLPCACAATRVCACAIGAVYICIGCLLHCRKSVPTGRGTASRCERLVSWRRRRQNLLCYSSRPPSVIINRGAKIINVSQIRRAMIEVTAQIGKLFLLAQRFFLSLLLFVSVFCADGMVSHCTCSHSCSGVFHVVLYIVTMHMISEVIITTL